MKLKLLILVIVAVFCATIFASVLFYSKVYIEEVWVYNADLEVDDHGGINVENDAFHFGSVPAGSFAKRRVIVSHQKDRPLRVKFVPEGNLAPWVVVDPNNFILYPDQNLEVQVTSYVPESAPLGNYTGTIKVMFFKVLW